MLLTSGHSCADIREMTNTPTHWFKLKGMTCPWNKFYLAFNENYESWVFLALVVIFKWISKAFIGQHCANLYAPNYSGDRTPLRYKEKLTWVAILFIQVLNWSELKSVLAVPRVTWLFLRKCCLSFHLCDILSRLKSLVLELSTIVAFYAGMQNARFSQIKIIL